MNEFNQIESVDFLVFDSVGFTGYNPVTLSHLTVQHMRVTQHRPIHLAWKITAQQTSTAHSAHLTHSTARHTHNHPMHLPANPVPNPSIQKPPTVVKRVVTA